MTELWDHQRKAIARAMELENLALFHEAGTGKTRSMIEILRFRYNHQKRVMRTLIFGPLIVVEQWKREFAKFSKVPQEKIITLTGTGAQRLKKFARAKELNPTGFIAVMNYEGLLTDSLYDAITGWSPEIIVYDESHRCKDPRSKRVKKLRPVASQARHRYILTGTPVLNSPMDLFAQYLLLDGGQTFGHNFIEFRARYFYDENDKWKGRKNYFPAWKVKPDSMPKFQSILARTAVQARKEECLDLPPLIDVELPVGMAPDQQKAYLEMERLYVTLVKEQVITAQLAITQALRMRQILAGFAQDTGSPPVFFKDNPRLDALVEKVEDLVDAGQKVIIWSEFQPTYKMIADALAARKISATFLTGEQGNKEKDDNVQAFRRGEFSAIIANPAAGGTGVHMAESGAAIYYTKDYNLGNLIQSRARNYRGGSEMHDKVTHYHLKSPGTIDEVIEAKLDGKEDMAELLLAWAKTVVLE